jgi:HPt (histidine-containing phosphotransfer) domain-containing protein
MNKIEPINQNWLESMASTKKDFTKKLFEVFIRDEPARVIKIKEAYKSNNFNELKYLAHSLKGASATMGADRVRESCLKLEKSALKNDAAVIEANLKELEEEMEHLYQFMKKFLEE